MAVQSRRWRVARAVRGDDGDVGQGSTAAAIQLGPWNAPHSLLRGARWREPSLGNLVNATRLTVQHTSDSERLRFRGCSFSTRGFQRHALPWLCAHRHPWHFYPFRGVARVAACTDCRASGRLVGDLGPGPKTILLKARLLFGVRLRPPRHARSLPGMWCGADEASGDRTTIHITMRLESVLSLNRITSFP